MQITTCVRGSGYVLLASTNSSEPIMELIDFKKAYGSLYRPSSKKPELVSLPAMTCLAIDGDAAPGSDDFQAAIGALFGTAYTLRFTRRREGSTPDFTIGPLEGEYRSIGDESGKGWSWRLMLWVPDIIGAADVRRTVRALKEKKGVEAGPVDRVRLRRIAAGTVVQMMHIGPYDAEQPTIDRMLAFAEQEHLRLDRAHHEVYLGDPRRSRPEKLKTILRFGVRRRATAA